MRMSPIRIEQLTSQQRLLRNIESFKDVAFKFLPSQIKNDSRHYIFPSENQF